MLADKNPAIAEAAQTMYQLSEDDLVRERCFARQEHYRILQTYEEQLDEDKRILQTYEEQLDEDKRVLQTKDDLIRAQAAELAKLKAQLATQTTQ